MEIGTVLKTEEIGEHHVLLDDICETAGDVLLRQFVKGGRFVFPGKTVVIKITEDEIIALSMKRERIWSLILISKNQ